MGGCLAGIYSCCCCQCNFMVFPSPPCSYSATESSQNLKYFVNSSGNSVPYIFIKTENALHNLIFFHGNAQDIGYSPHFLVPIAQKIKANVYVIEYPSYGLYTLNCPARISNKIKSDSVQFYNFLVNRPALASDFRVTKENTIIMGRSIGSGGATYLACQQKLNNLILISPFSDIPSVAKDFVGCVGNLVKCHFDNMNQLQNYNGRLLVIHGRNDEVINCRHGEMIANYYVKKNPSKCKFNFPRHMTHNQFDYTTDILIPVVDFVRGLNFSH